jgi:hypothetical protein
MTVTTIANLVKSCLSIVNNGDTAMSFSHLAAPSRDDGLRYIVTTYDPQRGVNVFWDGGNWTPHEEDAAIFRTEGGARHTAATTYAPQGAPEPEAKLAKYY